MRNFHKGLITLGIKFYYINFQVIYMLILLDLDVLSNQCISQFYNLFKRTSKSYFKIIYILSSMVAEMLCSKS
jgi:hypothetical protein